MIQNYSIPKLFVCVCTSISLNDKYLFKKNKWFYWSKLTPLKWVCPCIQKSYKLLTKYHFFPLWNKKKRQSSSKGVLLFSSCYDEKVKVCESEWMHTFSLRMSSGAVVGGFSMATSVRICSRWFCITSLKQQITVHGSGDMKWPRKWRQIRKENKPTWHWCWLG